MKNLKKVSLTIVAIMMFLTIGGCGNNQEESGNNFKLSYDSEKTVDKIIFKVGDWESDLRPMNNDKKVKKGYSSSVVLEEVGEVNFSIQIIDDGKIIFEKNNQIVDLGKDKKAEIKIIDDKDGKVDLEMLNN